MSTQSPSIALSFEIAPKSALPPEREALLRWVSSSIRRRFAFLGGISSPQPHEAKQGLP